ncbi:hypothetical protein FGO68_gene14584 [Halteria grandinella]|uniref:Uncharacterized protein n=1 Tax=Halteria grandinella TaxID=5974 RepID=A0A8J8NQL5_HALGN|nr:hypothetical protein FGO68_gene14584 [Halteria grandinella]
MLFKEYLENIANQMEKQRQEHEKELQSKDQVIAAQKEQYESNLAQKEKESEQIILGYEDKLKQQEVNLQTLQNEVKEFKQREELHIKNDESNKQQIEQLQIDKQVLTEDKRALSENLQAEKNQRASEKTEFNQKIQALSKEIAEKLEKLDIAEMDATCLRLRREESVEEKSNVVAKDLENFDEEAEVKRKFTKWEQRLNVLFIVGMISTSTLLFAYMIYKSTRKFRRVDAVK